MAKNKTKVKNLGSNISPFNSYWGKNNYILFGLGIVILLLGFILMAQGPWDNPLSLTLSPIVLLFAYIIVIPISILYKKKNSTVKENVSSKN